MKRFLFPFLVLTLFGLSACNSGSRTAPELKLTLKNDEMCYVYRVSSQTSAANNLYNGLAFSYGAGATIAQYDHYFTIKKESKTTYFSNSYWGYYIQVGE